MFQDGSCRLIPWVSSEAAGSPALLPEGKNFSFSTTVSRCSLESTARAHVCAQMVNAWPWAWWRSNRTAAAEQAHVRAALPSFWPDVPSRFPAEALAHVTRRQEDPQSCPRGKRWIAWMA